MRTSCIFPCVSWLNVAGKGVRSLFNGDEAELEGRGELQMEEGAMGDDGNSLSD